MVCPPPGSQTLAGLSFLENSGAASPLPSPEGGEGSGISSYQL